MVPKSFIRSPEIVAIAKKITGTVKIPSEKTLGEKSAQQLSKLALKKVEWYDTIFSLGITLNDGKSCKSGKTENFTESHDFD